MMCIIVVNNKLKSLVLSVRHKSVLDRFHSIIFSFSLLLEMQV
jgi:hypothetical protein